MTAPETVAFLTEAGLIAKVWEGAPPGHETVSFKVRDVSFAIVADAADPEFLKITCAYRLDAFPRDRVKTYEALHTLEGVYKVAKISVDLDAPMVIVAAEQFVASGEAMTRIFWRTIDLVGEAATRAVVAFNDAGTVGVAPAELAERVERSLRRRPPPESPPL